MRTSGWKRQEKFLRLPEISIETIGVACIYRFGTFVNVKKSIE